jgi:hypothetical protein
MPNVQEKPEPHARVDAMVVTVNAFSPTAFALLVEQFGWQVSLYALLGSWVVTWISIELMSRWYEGAQVRARSRVATRA